MKRVSNRAAIAMLLVIVLLVGMGLFLTEVVMNGGKWVTFAGSPHVYTGSNIGCGVVTDRAGVVLLTATDGRSYSEDAAIRQATLHWLGDRYGYISAPAIASYAEEMVGYDLLNGLYSYSGTGGEAVLTISAEIQKVALEALGSKKGTVAVYNYETGEILCAVTTPTYDPDNVPENMEGKEAYEGVFLNRFTQVTYTPGSIFKVVTAAAALETVEEADRVAFSCTGSFSMNGGTVTCQKKHGTVDLWDALEKSCNCYFAQLSAVLGEEKVAEYLRQFEMAESVEFDGITTASGSFSITDSTDAELAWSCIGQYKDLVNPCRFLMFMGAIAGDGRGAQPHIVAQAGSYRARTDKSDRIMEKETADLLQQMMRNDVVNKYGADNFPGLTVCAKSGTAEIEGKRPNATFAGFVTDAQYPLAFVVFVEDAGSGADTCVPILSKVLAACKNLMDSE